MDTPYGPPAPLPKFLARAEAARFLSERFFKISKQTLADYAVSGAGPTEIAGIEP